MSHFVRPILPPIKPLAVTFQILDMYESQDVVKSNAAGAQAVNADDDWEL